MDKERSYTEEEVKRIMTYTWISCEENKGNDFEKSRDLILQIFNKLKYGNI